MIHLTQSAANEIKRLQDSRQQHHHYFRLGVKPGGCSGWFYTLNLSETIQKSDRHYESQGISIVVDEQSDGYLQELTLDYSEDLMGGGFRFHNPAVSSICGCGQSFAASA
jgi:iron-sulfur cluster assembly accessory protein